MEFPDDATPQTTLDGSTDDPTLLGDGSQQQPVDPTEADPGSPPIEDPFGGDVQESNPWDSIDPNEPGPKRRDHERALHNARQKAIEEALGGRTRDEVEQAIALQGVLSNPNSALAYMLQAYPQLAESLTPRQPSQHQGQQQTELEFPKPVLDQYTGQYYYPAAQMQEYFNKFQQRVEEQVQGRLQQNLQPFEQQAEQQQRAAEANRQLDNYEATLEGFSWLLQNGHIGNELRRDGRATVLSAYKRAYDKVYKPARTAAERKALMQTLNKKANANTEGRPTGAGQVKPRTSKELQSMGSAGWDAAFEEAENETS